MREDASLEHLLERVTLVKGAGERGHGQLCVMSLAALIAGERHSDHPHAVSPLIRRFAIAINDALPDAERQRLKLFAPRMVGTDDMHDKDRARLLLSILTGEIVPALRAEDAKYWLAAPGDVHDPTAALEDLVGRTLQQARKAVIGKNVGEVADCTSSLLVTCAKAAPNEAIRQRCWSRAIDLFDRLCSVKDENRLVMIPERVAAAHRTLDKSGLLKRIDMWMANMATSLARRFRAIAGRTRLVAGRPMPASDSSAQGTRDSQAQPAITKPVAGTHA